MTNFKHKLYKSLEKSLIPPLKEELDVVLGRLLWEKLTNNLYIEIDKRFFDFERFIIFKYNTYEELE